MKAFIKLSLLLSVTLGVLGCNNVSSSEVNNDSSNAEIASSNVDLSSSETSSLYSYDFPKKEDGLSLDEINEVLDAMDPQPQEKRKVRYNWHIVEKLIGTYQTTMSDGTLMPEGEYTLDMVTETRTDNMDANLKVISGEPYTKNQRLYTTYSAAVTPKGWLSYHKQRRQFLDSAQEGEGFEERFYTEPLTLWMMIWGRRPANASIDGEMFDLYEFERVYNTEGYCTTFYMREFHYIKGTLTSWNNGSHYYNGTYEWITNCTLEYID